MVKLRRKLSAASTTTLVHVFQSKTIKGATTCANRAVAQREGFAKFSSATPLTIFVIAIVDLLRYMI